MKKQLFFLLSTLFYLYSCIPATDGSTQSALAEVKELAEEARLPFIPDKRVALWEVDYRLSDNDLTISGQTTSPEAKSALICQLNDKGYRVKDSLRLLPDANALEGKIYGVVNLSVCNMRSANDFSSEMITQALLGMPVKVIEYRDWYRIQTPDNYLGWVHRAGITPMTKEEINLWNLSEKVVITSHCGFTYEKPDMNSQTVSDVVAGDRLKWIGTEQGYYKVAYPDGRKAYVPFFMAKLENEWRASLKQDVGSILQTARTLMGVPYLWAGTSSKGMDCSGMVRTVLYMHDIIIPRDASQQAMIGRRIEISSDFSNLKPGDLVFFGRKATEGKKERVVHVAFYLGDKKFIHSQGDVRINSLDPADADFDEFNLDRLLFATRILDRIQEIPEISTTDTNPYYLLQK